MSEDDRQRWNRRYTAGAYLERTHPSSLISDWLAQPELTPGHNRGGDSPGRALDVACGAGRNARFLATHGYCVDAVDISSVALARARSLAQAAGCVINWIEADLEADDEMPVLAQRYDLIVIVRYLNLSLLRLLSRRLGPGGVLICELNLQTDTAVVGPPDSRFRVAPGALVAAAGDLQVRVAEEGFVTDPDGNPACLARLIAQRAVGDSAAEK